jgi:ferredoxin-NADP reductase
MNWRAQGYFLSCQAVLAEDLEVAPADALASVEVVTRRIERPAPDIARIFLEPAAPFDYRAGQFVHVMRADGLTRPYSLASLPGEDDLLELHVKRVAGGAMSGYLHEALRAGDRLTVRGPAGACFYLEGRPEQPLVLGGTGTGLAPLLGIARDAIARGHRGSILLHHGAVRRRGLYADQALRELARRCPALSYLPCVLEGDGEEPPVHSGSIDDLVMGAVRAHKDCRVFLCGAPERVFALRKAAFLAGLPLWDILADAFVMSRPRP